jgi:hypothetical protein
MKRLIATLALLPLMFSPAYAVDTNVSIAVKSKDALFIGEAVGGSYVVVRDKRNGDVLAEGQTIGNSGDKTKIMGDLKRDAVITDSKHAHFSFSLDLYAPTPVSIEVSGPYGQMQSMVKANADYLLIPGKDYESGNGIIVELPGFIVDVMAPAINHKGKFSADLTLPLQANVAKLCGCHIEKSGTWPADRYEVEASIYRGDIFLASVKMEPLDQASLFGANLKFQEAGTYRVMVTAFDPNTKEGGVDSTTITLEP